MKNDGTEGNSFGKRLFIAALRLLGAASGLLILAVLFSGEIHYSGHTFRSIGAVALGIYCLCLLIPWRKIPLPLLRYFIWPYIAVTPVVLIVILEIKLIFSDVPIQPLVRSVEHGLAILFALLWLSQLLAVNRIVRIAGRHGEGNPKVRFP